MRRVVQWACWVGGIIVLLLTLFLQVGRYQKHPPQFALVTVKENGLERLYLYAPEQDYWRALTKPYDAVWQNGWHPSGNWFYVSGAMLNSNGDIVNKEVWRVSAGGLIAQYVPNMDYPLLSVWTPDGEWLVYGLFDENYYGDLYKVRADGRDLHNLTADFAPSVMVSTEGHPILMSPDGQSVIFSASTDWFEAHRIALRGGQPQNLMTEIEDGGGAQRWLYQTNWLIIDNGPYLYRVRPDGTEAQRLTSELEVSENLEWVLEQQDLMVISQSLSSGNIRLMGLNVNDSELRWEADGAWHVEAVTPDQQWLIVWSNYPERSIYRIRPSDGKAELIIELPTTAIWQGLSPDRKWLLYSLPQSNNEGVALYRVGIEDGQTKHLYTFSDLIRQMGWSSDNEWVLVKDYLEPQIAQYWVHIEGNAMKPQKRLIQQLFAWLPTINNVWSPSLMVVIGLSLLGCRLLIGRQIVQFEGRGHRKTI